FIDRIGKGIRTAPRDALLSASVPAEQRGAAFGIQRAMDNAGAVAGPLLAWILLQWFTGDFRVLFWIATVPMAAAMCVLIFGTKESAAATPARLPSSRDATARFKTTPA